MRSLRSMICSTLRSIVLLSLGSMISGAFRPIVSSLLSTVYFVLLFFALVAVLCYYGGP